MGDSPFLGLTGYVSRLEVRLVNEATGGDNMPRETLSLHVLETLFLLHQIGQQRLHELNIVPQSR